MGLFDFIRRRKPPAAPAAAAPAHSPASPTLTSDQLRDAIVDAHTKQDADRLQQLFNHHSPQIAHDCMNLTKCPDERKDDRDFWSTAHDHAV